MYFISKDGRLNSRLLFANLQKGHAARRLISNNGDDVIKKLLFSSAVSNERFACLIANLFHHAPSSPLLECFDVFTNLWVPCLQSWLRSDSFKMNLSALSIVYSSLFTFPGFFLGFAKRFQLAFSAHGIAVFHFSTEIFDENICTAAGLFHCRERFALFSAD